MKKIVALLAILIGSSASAQIKVKINGKPVTETTVTKAEDIKKMELAFDKPKKLSYYGTGRLFFWIEFLGEKGEVIESYSISKDGTNAVEAFLADVNVFYSLPTDASKTSDFEDASWIRGGEGINYKLMYFGKYYNYKTITFKVSLGFKDKTGYQQYGDLVNLVKPQTYTIDNSLNFTEGQKQKEAEKVVADAKKAEDDKKAEETNKQAEKSKKKGLIRGVLNKL